MKSGVKQSEIKLTNTSEQASFCNGNNDGNSSGIDLEDEDWFASLHGFAELLCGLSPAVDDDVPCGDAPFKLFF